MAPASFPKTKGKVPNLCTPQPFVTIYIARTLELAKQDKASSPLLLKSSSDSDSENVDSQLSSLTTVDPDVPKFLVHKNLICYYSPFFSAAFNGNFIEGTTQSMTLDVDKVAFGVLANWFYSQVVVSETGGRPYLVTLARVWIMAEQFLIPELQNQVMDAIHASLSSTSWVPSWFTDFARIAHGHGNGENPMVEIAVWVLRWCSEKDFDYHVARIPHGILVKVAQHLKKVANPDAKELTARKASEFYVSTGQEASSSHT